MGRKGSIPVGKGFMPGTSAHKLKRLANKEMDALTAKRYMAAYHRKKGRSFNEIAGMVLASYDAVRDWLVKMHKGGLKAAPRGKSPGRRRSIPLEIRWELIMDVFMGPQAAGYKANVWTFKLLHDHLEKKYKVKIAYSTAAKNFKEMGIRLKVPRPAHPKAASLEERLAFQAEARARIKEAAAAGYHTVFIDEGHAQGYKNGRETAGLRGVEIVRTSSVGRARLSFFVAVGYGWVFVMECPGRANSEAYTRFLDRVSALVGKIQTIDDNAGYHTSDRSSDHIRDNADRLRRIPTLPYTPNDNVAEPQIRGIKTAMSNVGLDSVGAISGELGWCFESDLVVPVEFYDYATTVDAPQISPRKAAGIKKRLGPGEHFVYVQRRMPEEEIALPTIEEIKAKEDKILPPEKRAELPLALANSNIPANFLARLPRILLEE